MGWLFWKGAGSGTWDLTSVQPPWSGEVSIYDHIASHIVPGVPGLSEGGDRLPDEKNDDQLKWVAGGLDGAFGHHGGSNTEKSRARMLHRAIGVVLNDASTRKMRLLYEQLLQVRALDVVDALLALIVEKQDLHPRRLETLAFWLANGAPDRDPVKFAIALLGVLPNADSKELLLTLGRHEEFTLYAAVALSNTIGDSAEGFLWQLAKDVKGWGRIQIVERLTKTENPMLKTWLLCEGYKNSVMYEYLAYACAVAGGLRDELAKPTIDKSLLAGAGDILVSLICGGPAESIDDYADGAFVVERYIHHLSHHPRELEQLITLEHIECFLGEEADWTARESRGWTQSLRDSILAKVRELKALPQWGDMVRSALETTDRLAFGRADLAAKVIGIDTWDLHFARLEAGIDNGWYYVMQTDDATRIDRVLALAEKLIPLGAVATGPGEALGLGPEWAMHGNLDFVLQDLSRFPGRGWSLIRTGLRSPVIRNRHMALRALSSWEQENWPPDARALLTSSLKDDPTKEVRDEIETLLAGKKLEPPHVGVDD